MAEGVGCQDCHDLSQPASVEAINRLCVDCHDEEYQGMLPSWEREVDDLFRDAEGQVNGEAKSLLQALRQAGPLHNVEATRVIVRRLIQGGMADNPPTDGPEEHL